MKKFITKRVSTLIGIVIILAVAVIAFGGIFAWQYFAIKSETQNSKSETNSNYPTDTDNRKTYVNIEYGFEFKYPDDFSLIIISESKWSFSFKDRPLNIKIGVIKTDMTSIDSNQIIGDEIIDNVPGKILKEQTAKGESQQVYIPKGENTYIFYNIFSKEDYLFYEEVIKPTFKFTK